MVKGKFGKTSKRPTILLVPWLYNHRVWLQLLREKKLLVTKSMSYTESNIPSWKSLISQDCYHSYNCPQNISFSFPILIIFFQGLEIFHYLSLPSIPKYFIIKRDTLLLLLITIDLFSASDLIACRSPLESLEWDTNLSGISKTWC